MCVCVFIPSHSPLNTTKLPPLPVPRPTSKNISQAKDLVEGAPCTLMQKVKKEDAAKIIEKLKAEGAECELV